MTGGVRDVGARVEYLLDALRAGAAPDPGPVAEELVRLLVGLYGDALGRIVAALADEGAAGAAVLDRLTADPLVESLLLLHDLHPLDVDARVQRALDRVRPYLGSHAGGVRYLGTRRGGAAAAAERRGDNGRRVLRELSRQGGQPFLQLGDSAAAKLSGQRGSMRRRALRRWISIR